MHRSLLPSETGLLVLALAMAAWPIISLMHNGAEAQPWQPRPARA